MLISPAALSKNKANFFWTNRFSFFFFKSAVFRVRVFTVPARERRVIAAYANESVGVENDLRLGRSATLVTFFFYVGVILWAMLRVAGNTLDDVIFVLWNSSATTDGGTPTATTSYNDSRSALHVSPFFCFILSLWKCHTIQGGYDRECIVLSFPCACNKALGAKNKIMIVIFFSEYFSSVHVCWLYLPPSHDPPSTVLPPLYFCTLFMENIDTEA